MYLAQNPQRRDIAKRENIVKCPLERWPVIKHQQHARQCLDEEQEESNSAHAPRVTERDTLLFDRDRMKVEKEVGEHDDDTISSIHRHWVAKNTLPNLRVPNDLSERRHASILKTAARVAGILSGLLFVFLPDYTGTKQDGSLQSPISC